MDAQCYGLQLGHLRNLALCTALVLACGAVHAQVPFINRIEIAAGTGDHAQFVSLGAGTRDLWVKPLGRKARLQVYVLGRLGYWTSLEDHPLQRYLIDASAMPVLRIEQVRANGKSPALYFELGVGFHLLSHTRLNSDRIFSTLFQFGEFIGPGILFGDRGQYQLGLRVEHISNAGIQNPNDGLTYGSAVFQYRFQ